MLNRLLENKVSSKLLGIFRVAFFLNFFFEVKSLFDFRNLIFDKVPYFEPSEISFTYVFLVWMIVIGLMIVGFKTKTISLLNFVISLFVIGSIKTYEYHMFYAYMSVNFLTLFIPLSKSFSLDNLFEKLKYSTLKVEHKPKELVPEFFYFILVFAGIGLFYLDSTFYKLASELWLNGLGMWLPSSIPLAVKVDGSIVLNNEFLSKFLGYFTIIFELIFVFLFWNRKFKIPFFIIGVVFHIGIFILWPIPHFALGVIALYLLLLPINLPEKFKLKFNSKKLIVLYNQNSLSSFRTKIIIQHFDIFKSIEFIPKSKNYTSYSELEKIPSNEIATNFCSLYKGKTYKNIDTCILILKKLYYTYPLALLIKIPGLYQLSKLLFNKYVSAKNNDNFETTNTSNELNLNNYLNDNQKIKLFRNFNLVQLKNIGFKIIFFSLIIFQINASIKSPLIRNKIRYYSFYDTYIEKSKFITNFSKEFIGITNHSVFVDSHFKGYNHIIKVEYKTNNGAKIVLPIINNLGMPDNYLKGGIWAKWTFRVSMPKINQVKLSNGIRDFTAYWLNNNFISGDPYSKHTFVISVKKIDSTKKWEKDFLKKQFMKPWVEAGTLTWVNGKCTADIQRIESI